MTEAALAGRCVLVTRPASLAADTIDMLKRAGCNVLHLPVIEIRPRTPANVASQVAPVAAPDIVIFVSRNAVVHGIALAGDQSRIVAIGPATKSALEDRGITVDITPASGHDTESLLEHQELAKIAGKQILIVRGQSGRPLLGDTLAERGARVEYVAVYDRLEAQPEAGVLDPIRERLVEGAIDFTMVMSVDSLSSLVSILADPDFRLLRKSTLVTPSRRVIQTARDRLPSVQCVLASDPRAQGMVRAMQSYLTSKSDSSDIKQ